MEGLTPNHEAGLTTLRNPIIARHFGLPEDLAWEPFRAAALEHDLEHTPRTWLNRRHAYGQWAAAFLGDEGQTA